MTDDRSESNEHVVAVLGAGPAGLYAARKLAEEGISVVLINRDLKPGGLAEYGIYPTKHKLKEGLRKQFRKILALPNVHYLGGVSVGDNGVIKLSDLEQLDFSATLFTIGAQGTRSLGVPGESDCCGGIYHAKDLVYHFNQLPPFATKEFPVGERVGIIGMGNVMVDIAHWLVTVKKVKEVIVIGRRGPAQRAYTDKEMKELIQAWDLEALDAELTRIQPQLEATGVSVESIKEDLLAPMEKAKTIDSPTSFRFVFLSSTKQLIADEQGRLTALEVERNELVERDGRLRPKGTGELTRLSLDTLVFAIGDQVDEGVGLPFEWGKFKVAEGSHPRDPERPRYEVYDEERGARPGYFLGGWARVASDGLVGKARADGENAADEVLHYLQHNDVSTPSFLGCCGSLKTYLETHNIPYVDKHDIKKLEAIEQAKAKELGKEFFKFDTDEQMFAALGKERS